MSTAECPDCRLPMRDVSARARTGYLLALDQCERCGGVWFDRWELFPLHHAEVERLDPVDGKRLHQPAESGALGNCPRCDVGMREFRDANLPDDARIGRCHVCEGMWLQSGQLRIVKREAVRSTPLPSKPEDAIVVELAKAYADDAKWSNVEQLDAATYETEEPPPDFSTIGDALKSTVPWIALQVLFRMLLRR